MKKGVFEEERSLFLYKNTKTDGGMRAGEPFIEVRTAVPVIRKRNGIRDTRRIRRDAPVLKEGGYIFRFLRNTAL